MNLEETYVWAQQLLPEPQTLDRFQVGESFPEFTVLQVELDSDETVAMTVDAGRIEAGLEAEAGTEVRVEFVTVVAEHGGLAGELVAAAATMVSQDPVGLTPQPGTVMRGLADHVRDDIPARHGLLIVPFLWEAGVPQVHEVSSGGGRRAKRADQTDADGETASGKDFDYTHPGRLTVPAQVVLLTDEELTILEDARAAGGNGVDELQEHLSAQNVNINDLWR